MGASRNTCFPSFTRGPVAILVSPLLHLLAVLASSKLSPTKENKIIKNPKDYIIKRAKTK